MRRFIKKLILCFLPLFLIIPLLPMIYNRSYHDNIGILNYQIQKLKQHNGKKFAILFIGDSSGGNAINTECKNAINLCLTGSFGYVYQKQFLEYVENFIDYDTLIVINTLDISTRSKIDEIQDVLNLHSSNYFQSILSSLKLKHYFSKVIKSYFKKPIWNTVNFNDYPFNYKRTKADSNIFDNSINPRQLKYFKDLQSSISKKGKVVKYFFGPSLPYKQSYYTRICQILKNTGIKHSFNKPFLLDSLTKGNTEDHIHPDYKTLSTNYYFKLIRSKDPIELQ